MEHKHLDAATLERLLAMDRTAEQNESLFHLLAVCPQCREMGGGPRASVAPSRPSKSDKGKGKISNDLREGLQELMRRLAEGRPRRECLEALGDYRDLTTRELAHLEQVSVRTLEDWAERGDGPPYRKAGRRNARRRYPLCGYLDWRDRTTMVRTVERHKNMR